MSSKDKKLTKTQTNRLPAPALFVGPPSHNASNTSLLSPNPDIRSPAKTLVQQRSLLSPDVKRPLPPTIDRSQYDDIGSISSHTSAPFLLRQRQQSRAAEAEASSRAEAVWAEMQNTLEEVELSAIKGPGISVFGSEHSRALDELRMAQIELAKAWARSGPEEDVKNMQQETKVQDISVADLEPPSSRARGGSASSQLKGDKLFDRIKLEEETEKDIELSKKRREENDRYFEKVNMGVQEVVLKLEAVAKAMRVVESESKEIWEHDTDPGAETESLSTMPSVT